MALGEEFEIVEQAGHGGVVAVGSLGLEGEALGKGARRDAGGIEGLDQGKARGGLLEGDADRLGDGRKRGREIAGFLEFVDDRGGDQAFGATGTAELGH